MRKVIYSMMVSLDGFIEGPNRNIDWIIIDEELHKYINDQQAELGAFLYGRRMYEIMAGYWPTANADPSIADYMLEFAHIWKYMPKIVFSKTLDKVEWNSRLIRENIAGELLNLKAQPGKNFGLGGANIAETFMKLELIDEYQLFVQPIVLGSGTPYFPALDDKINLRLVDTHRFGSGVILLHYQRADE